MKKRLTLSLSAAALILGVATLGLQAGNDGLKDQVAQKEAQALQKNGVAEQSAAAADVDAKSVKEFYQSLRKASTFAKEAREDRAQRLERVFHKEAGYHKDGMKGSVPEVVQGLQLTIQAAQDIQANKLDDAAKKLEQASANFDKALKANPALALVPVNQSIRIQTFAGGTRLIEKALEMADRLIQQHRTQEARELLMPLRDEMDFTVDYLPMQSYPSVAKKAAELLKQGKAREALAVLSAGFNTLVSVTDVVPIPLMLANDMVLQASKLAKEKKEEALKLLEAAKNQLARAELLGYTQKHAPEYKALSSSIEALKKEIKGKNETKGLYDELKRKFEELFKKIREEGRK